MEHFQLQWNGWTVLFSITAAQALLLALVFFTISSENKLANRLMGAFMLCFAITMLDYVGFWTFFHYNFPYFADIYKIAGFCFGPLLLLYFKALDQQDHRLPSYEWLHLLPAALVFLHRLVFYFLPFDMQVAIAKSGVPRFVDPILWLWLRAHWAFMRWITYHMLLYIPIIWIYIKFKNKRIGVENFNGSVVLQKRWHYTLFILYVGFVMGHVIYHLMLITGNYTLFYDFSISLAITIFVFVVGFLGYYQPKIFSGKILQQVFLPSKYQSSTLTPQAVDSILRKLLDYMDAEKPYQNNELRLTSLADQIGIPHYQLSQVINQKVGKSYADFINSYRLRAVEKMLADPAYQEVPVMQIAYEAGFNNRTTFYKLFKDQFGMSPVEYRQQAATNFNRINPTNGNS